MQLGSRPLLYALAAVLMFATTSAAQVHVLISGGFRAPFDAVVPDFERTTGIKVTTTVGMSQGNNPTVILTQLRSGVEADVVILGREGLDDIIADRRIFAGTDTNLALTPLAVAVRSGALKPDISTVDAFKATLLRAKAVAFMPSTTGIYLQTKLFPRLGIADQLAKKSTTLGVAEVVQGNADLSIQPASELIGVAGADFVGPVPKDVQFVSVFAAAVVNGSKQLDLSKRLIAYLASDNVDAAIKRSGMERPSKPQLLSIAEQGSFFVGGQDVHSDTLSATTTRRPSGTITVDQVYVHYQVPATVTSSALTLIHGCCLTGKTWETTPDGRMGWDEYFVRQGHAVYVVDQAFRGRSASNPSTINAVKVGQTAADRLPSIAFVSHEEAWEVFRFGPTYPKTFGGMQFPLDAQQEFWKQMVPDWVEALPTPNPTVSALSELAQRINGTVLMSHSQSGIYPFQTAAISTKGITGIIAIEPGACPDAKSDLKPYVSFPVLVLFGDYVDQSARWKPRLQMCRDFAAAANNLGGRVQITLLPDVGFHGNSHMLMQDKNSLEIADWLSSWIDQNISSR